MNGALLSSLMPVVKHTVYWEKKDVFLLYEDIYKIWVMFVVESGSFYYEIGESKGTATFGDIVICPPDTVFRRVIVTPLTFYYVELVWEGPGAEKVIPAGSISISNTSRLAQNYAVMKKWKAWPISMKSRKYKHYLQDLWQLYCDELGEGSLSGESEEDRQPEPLMQQAHLMIQQHAFRALNLKDIAEVLDISPVQLTKKFTASFGVTPLRYLTSLRLGKAKRLLVETDMTIEHIAENCGYQNGFYLHRMFVKYEHTTPSHYRKSHRI
ncbi:helix-turn-helix domain-containing protein [Paenibacillus ginsengarvi]|uniref:AraC family transcriptional regulator n=1 Tax=Paenibacillus ginsengarvi TaxID=400777 RepID=A0A3B0CPV5_9BACL|nr:AraC family transcriptional regulator [Paenibacillus ginsengarvi]RKN86264.1 AraC family transcriptional regulator [Paenibacillus ginsengarvi]